MSYNNNWYNLNTSTNDVIEMHERNPILKYVNRLNPVPNRSISVIKNKNSLSSTNLNKDTIIKSNSLKNNNNNNNKCGKFNNKDKLCVDNP